MLMQVLRWYRGYLWLHLKGVTTERFLNLCRNQNIYLWDVCMQQDSCFCKMELSDYWQVRKIARKTHTFPKVEKRIGFPFWSDRVWKRKGMVLGFTSGVLLVYILSLHVWNISFEGQSIYTEERLLKYLSSIQVKTGMKKSDVDCQNIEEQIRLQYPDIGWVSAELEGTKLNISMVETNMPVPAVEKKDACHLVASHDGVVDEIITRSGTPLVKEGDEVKKGDILISGILELKDDGGTVTKKEAVCADGDIKIKTKYTYEDSCQKRYKKKKYTGQEKKAWKISMGGKNLFFTNPFKGFNKERKYDIIANECNISVSKSFCLPVSYGNIRYREYEEIDADYSEEELKKILNKRFLYYVEKIEKEGVSVLENQVYFKKQTEDIYQASGTLTVTEPANEYQDVDESEWRIEQIDEFDGDND